MSGPGFQIPGVSDPRLAVHATSALPAWLWSTDGAHVLWANPVGAKLLGAATATALAGETFGPADPQRRQVTQLAGRLAATAPPRLERLRGFGASFGRFVTCACTRLEFPDGSAGMLIAAVEPVGRAMPLIERLRALVEGTDTPIAAFARDGEFVGASDAARPLLGFRDLNEAGLDAARNDALKNGRAEIPIGIGHIVLQRVGSGADIGLLALLTPGTPHPQLKAEQPAAKTLAANDLPESTSQANAPEQSAEPAAAIAPQVEVPADHEPAAEPTSEADKVPMHGDADSSTSERSAAPPPDAPGPTVLADTDSEQPSLIEPAADAENAPNEATEYSFVADPELSLRRKPLRFVWQMDADGRFSLGSDEFSRLIGARTAAALGRHWSEIADALQLDPDGRVAGAVATRNTWSGITLHWPVDSSNARLPVELSGLPVFDRDGGYAGYRGFGVCRDLEAMARVASQRTLNFDSSSPLRPLAADVTRSTFVRNETAPATIDPSDAAEASSEHGRDVSDAAPQAAETDPPAIQHNTSIEQAPAPASTREPVMTGPTQQNVVPFPSAMDQKSPALTPVENNAFNELARQLSARLEGEAGAVSAPTEASESAEPEMQTPTEPASAQPDWLLAADPPARGEAPRDKTLFDLLPVGVLIYRLDQLLYANAAFLLRVGYDNLHALAEAGGLDALLVEPGVSSSSSTSQSGTPVTLTAAQASPEHGERVRSDARLFAIAWDSEDAHALILSTAHSEAPRVPTAAADIPAPPAAGHADAEDLGAILDTTAEGVVMFDAEGKIHACNRSAEALFGVDGHDLVARHLADLFAPESQRAVADYFDGIKGNGVASLLEQGRELLGRVRNGGVIPLAMTMGRTRTDGPNFFAVFRDLSQTKKIDTELPNARQADRAATAKADVLARISHEIRTPLNAIIGFADVMIEERFGALGNERYIEYMKDIRASGERVIATINDLLDLSRIETGTLDLAFAEQNLNDLVESCVAVTQPQANRERIIIRTSLAHGLPPVIADARALRQIAMNLIGNSIHLANAGGQVIVSTALSDFGDVVLRVRDTGHGLNDNEVAAAMEPFRTAPLSDQAGDGGGVSLSLTKALVEANRAQFQIKATPQGTLIEVVFGRTMAGA